MTDVVDFETAFETRLRARASRATRPFDAAALARAVVAADRRSHRARSSAWPSWTPSVRWPVAVALALVLGGAVIAAGTWLQKPLPVVLPLQSPYMPAPPSPAATVFPWPGARGDHGPGLYAWDMLGGTWMHNVTDGYHGVTLTLTYGAPVHIPFPTPDGSSGTKVSVAGHSAMYREAAPDFFGVRRLQWIVEQLAGRTVYITIEVPQRTTDAALTEIHAMIASMRLEQTPTPPGFRLVFETRGGWDTG